MATRTPRYSRNVRSQMAGRSLPEVYATKEDYDPAAQQRRNIKLAGLEQDYMEDPEKFNKLKNRIEFYGTKALGGSAEKINLKDQATGVQVREFDRKVNELNEAYKDDFTRFNTLKQELQRQVDYWGDSTERGLKAKKLLDSAVKIERSREDTQWYNDYDSGKIGWRDYTGYLKNTRDMFQEGSDEWIQYDSQVADITFENRLNEILNNQETTDENKIANQLKRFRDNYEKNSPQWTSINDNLKIFRQNQLNYGWGQFWDNTVYPQIQEAMDKVNLEIYQIQNDRTISSDELHDKLEASFAKMRQLKDFERKWQEKKPVLEWDDSTGDYKFTIPGFKPKELTSIVPDFNLPEDLGGKPKDENEKKKKKTGEVTPFAPAWKYSESRGVERSLDAETRAGNEFRRIFQHNPDFAQGSDQVAINIIAYGYEPGDNRDLGKENEAIGTFGRVYGRQPSTSYDWNLVKAIAYSGASR